MLPRALIHLFVALTALGGFGSASSQSEFGLDSHSVRVIPIRPSVLADEEEIDLHDRSDPSPQLTPGCDGTPTKNSIVVGAWAGAGSPCSARAWARSQVPLAMAANQALWCSDPAGSKARSRTAAAERAKERAALSASREALRAAQTQRGLASWRERSQLSAPSKLGVEPATLIIQNFTPPVQTLEPAPEPALAWDVRETEACRAAPELDPVLAPALSAFALGKIATSSGTCDAMLVEANFSTGRFAGSRLSWPSAKCAGFASPLAADIAKAAASGSDAVQTWQDALFRSWRWSGPNPRPARARSADWR